MLMGHSPAVEICGVGCVLNKQLYTLVILNEGKFVWNRRLLRGITNIKNGLFVYNETCSLILESYRAVPLCHPRKKCQA